MNTFHHISSPSQPSLSRSSRSCQLPLRETRGDNDLV